MAAPDFWDHKDRAQKLVAELSQTKAVLTPYRDLARKVEDFALAAEMAGEDPEMAAEAEDAIEPLFAQMEKLELMSFLSGRFDKGNCILNINAGSGGTESCDWADMLFRMYTRWIERSGFKGEVLNVNEDDVAGIKSASIMIEGPYAYGYTRCERGVHRLVRISPFGSGDKRQTSFASVDVSPIIEEDIDMEIPEKDLDIKFTRSSGAGGQHVNTTDSACQMRHIPTGIVVNCQNERSAHQNKATALKILTSRLYEMEVQRLEDMRRQESGLKLDSAFGSQIRNYVLYPYQLVKDTRTEVETSDTTGVLDGDIDRFIEAFLRHGKKKQQ